MKMAKKDLGDILKAPLIAGVLSIIILQITNTDIGILESFKLGFGITMAGIFVSNLWK